MAQISKEYGSALFDAASERGETDSVYEAAKQLSAIFKENPDYIELLSAPSLPKPERITLAKQALSGNVPDTLCAFVQLLCERGYLRCFPDCVAEYAALYDAARSIIAAEVTSAVPLRPEEEKKLRIKLEKMSGKTVRLSAHVDASLLGGMTVLMNGTLYDGSIKGNMKEIKDVMDR